MNRIDYWNSNYVDYWKKVTDEGNKSNGVYSEIKKSGEKKDFIVIGESKAEQLFDCIKLNGNEKLLDFGCGFGRFYPYFSSKCNYTGIDISKEMIRAFVSTYPNAKESVFVSEGENLPFSNNTFDVVVCFGVFDACYQEQALYEMLRVCKIGGRILFTGKNNDYCSDDEAAIIAEEAARKKGHPNYFSDVKKMKEEIHDYIQIEMERYYLKRGDFGLGKYYCTIPEYFYEWAFLIKKTKENKEMIGHFSDDYSRTWITMEGNVK